MSTPPALPVGTAACGDHMGDSEAWQTNENSLPHSIEGIVVEINAVKAVFGKPADTVGI
jgi:hypothetical protein